jgi:hypothetical protein
MDEHERGAGGDDAPRKLRLRAKLTIERRSRAIFVVQPAGPGQERMRAPAACCPPTAN